MTVGALFFCNIATSLFADAARLLEGEVRYVGSFLPQQAGAILVCLLTPIDCLPCLEPTSQFLPKYTPNSLSRDTFYRIDHLASFMQTKANDFTTGKGVTRPWEAFNYYEG